MRARRRFVSAPADRPPRDLARLILILSLAPTVGLGLGRFAYSLVLPDMRDRLGWSYSSAGFMNTDQRRRLSRRRADSRLVERFGPPAALRWSTAAAAVSLALCALTGNFIVLSFARLLVGSPRRSDSSPAERWQQRSRNRSRHDRTSCSACSTPVPPSAFSSSGLVAPFVLQYFGPGSWWIVWLAMTLLGHHDDGADVRRALRYRRERPADGAGRRFAIRPVIIFLAAYFLFGAGYIAYMTFMIAYVRDGGGGALAQSAFWSLIGLSAFVTPWVWRRMFELDRGGLSMPSSSASMLLEPRFRCSAIRRSCLDYRRWCSASRSSRW